MKVLIRLLLLLLPLVSAAQSQLLPCPVSGYKHNCFGSVTFGNARYVGEFRDGKQNGQGTWTHPNGAKYVGEYRDGKQNGRGTWTHPNGEKYVGEFRDGRFHGQGTLTSANGEKYVGEWRDDKRGGQGIEYRADGSINRSGQWSDDNLAQPFALDRSRFPFGGPSQAAAPATDTARAERDRLAAEAEVARLRQRELEQRLASEAQERERQAAEVEAVRRRQQELEAQLAALQSQQASRPPAQAAAVRNQRRVALVIGNAAYKVSPLENPVNDATDVDQTLRQLGFQTTLVRNATLGQMREATRRFTEQLQTADVALIYFAGHGIESKSKNYLIPVNADLKFEYELDDQGYNAGQWLEMLESIKSSNSERVNIVILDACRNNSLIGARSLSRGLGRMDAPTGTFLAYSTAPGKVAADGARGQR
ncbi:MAG: hypothetical protein FJY42_06530, partial [Betaproteobacteria bacterium]|nr:hypothetical protein [Betaproteobacteria bacterium]